MNCIALRNSEYRAGMDRLKSIRWKMHHKTRKNGSWKKLKK